MRSLARNHPRLFVAFVLLLPVVLGVAAWHYIALYLGATQARDDLLSAQAHLSTVGLDLSEDDIEVAQDRLASADRNLASVRRHLRWDPLVQGARHLPWVGGQVDATYDFVDIAALLVDAGEDGAVAGRRAVQYRDGPPTGQPLTASLVDLVAQTGPEVDRAEASVRDAVAIRYRIGDRKLLPPLGRLRDRIDSELPELANTVERARATRDLLPSFLGFEGDRRYLVVALNNGELLPGGGLVTAAGVLTLRDGNYDQLEFSDSTRWKAEWERKNGGYIRPPGPLQRYLLRDYPWNLLVSAWSPDYPTWARQALELYELVHGPQEVSGVLAVDLTVLERLLSVTGPKTLDVDGKPLTFTPENAILELERLTRSASAPPGEDRKSVIGDLATALLRDLLALPADRWDAALDVVQSLGRERHVQLLSFDAAEQTTIRDFGWDGRLRPFSGDYLHLSETSVGANKVNLVLGLEGDLVMDISAEGVVQHQLTLRYHNGVNEWSAGRDPALVRDLMGSGVYVGYLRLFVPDGARNIAVTVGGQPGFIDESGAEGALAWHGVLFRVLPGQREEVSFRWETSVPNAAGYELLFQKQAGRSLPCLGIGVRFGGRDGTAFVNGGAVRGDGRVCPLTDLVVTGR